MVAFSSIAALLMIGAVQERQAVLVTPRGPYNVILTMEGTCPEGAVRFSYFRYRRLHGDGSGPVKPQIVDLSFRGQRLPEAEIEKFDDWLDSRSIHNVHFRHCNYEGQPSVGLLIEFEGHGFAETDAPAPLAFYRVYEDRVELEEESN